MTEEPDFLPTGWVWSTVGELATFIGSGITPLGGQNVYVPTGVQFIRSQNVYPDGLHLNDVVYVTPRMHAEMKRTHVKPDDVLLNITGASIGRSTFVPHDLGEANVNQHVCIIRTGSWIAPAYLSWFLNSPLGQQQIFATESGVTRQGLNYSQIRRFRIPLAPLKEQGRIANIVEELMTRNRGARVRLERARSVLRQFRKATLAKAFRGQLSERNPKDEPAEKLLQRIRQERRNKWEEELTAKSKDPKKYRYPEFEIIELEGLPKLPEGWMWTQIGAVGEVVTGKTPPTSERRFYGDAVPFVKPGDLDTKGLVISSQQFLSKGGGEHVRMIPASSVMVTSIGATIGKTGMSGRAVVTNQQINSIVLPQCVEPFFVYYYCLSDFFQNQVRANASSTTLPILNKTRFQNLPLPLAPISEQNAICVRIRQAFVRGEEVESGLRIAMKQIGGIEESILSKAFRGDLSTQDPNDEPASVLLGRIRARRAATGKRGRFQAQLELVSPAKTSS